MESFTPQFNDIALRKLLKWKDLETKEITESFDHKLLINLFIKKLSTYQIEEFHYLEKDDIKDMRIWGPQLATYRPGDEVILIDVDKFKEIYPKEHWNVAFAHTVCHEQTHAFSHHACEITEDIEYVKRIDQVGFERQILNFDKSKEEVMYREVLMNFWNEGVTELFAREILMDYVAYKGLQEEYDSFVEITSPKEMQMYPDNVAEVLRVIQKISKKTGHNNELVKQAVFRGMFEGEDYLNPEIKEALDNFFYKGFTKTLSKKYNNV